MTLLLRRVTTGGLSFSILLFASAPASARPGDPPCYYDVTVLDLVENCNIAGGPSSTSPRAIADNGLMTGLHPQCNGSGFSWVLLHNQGTEVQGLIPPFAGVWSAEGRGISSTGRIAGIMDITGVGQRGFIREPNGQWTQFDPLPGGPHSGCFSVSGNSQYICGYRSDSSGYWRATLWEDGTATEIPTTLGPRSIANDVNNEGQVTGWHGTANSTDSRAFIYQAGIPLVTLPPTPDGYTSEGISIYGQGDVAGMGLVTQPDGTGFYRHGFFWSQGQMIDIGVLPDRAQTRVQCLNDRDEIVGYCTTESNGSYRAFYWRNGQMKAVEDMVDPALNLTMSIAWAVNSRGEIAGVGKLGSGPVVAIILSPPNMADINGDCVTDVQDLLILLGKWGMTGSEADLNGDDIVNVLDLLLLLGHWG